MESLAIKAISDRRALYTKNRKPPICTLDGWSSSIRSFFQNLSLVSYRTLNESTITLAEVKSLPNSQFQRFSVVTSYEAQSTNGVLGLLHISRFQTPISFSSYCAYLDLQSPIFTFVDRSKIRYLHINSVNHRLTIFDFEWLVYYHEVIEEDVEHRLPVEDVYTRQLTVDLLLEISKALQKQCADDTSFAIID